MKKVNSFKGLSVFFIVIFVLLCLYVLVLFYPMLWGLVQSFQDKFRFADDMLAFPDSLHFENYVTAMRYFRKEITTDTGNRTILIGMMAVNSIIYAGGAALVTTASCCVMGYVTAKYSFKLSRVIYGLVLVVMTLPIVGNLSSSLVIVKGLGLYDIMIGTILLKCNFISIYYMVFFEQFKAMPQAYSEAAQIDGASRAKIMFRIMIPLARTTISTVFLLFFIAYWNDYTTALTFAPSHPTLAYGLYVFNFTSTPDLAYLPVRLAGCMILLLPIFIVFCFAHKKLLGNISMGGLKE